MTTRISSSGPSTGVAPTQTAARVTAPPARPFKQVMNAGAQAVLGGAETALRRFPGGPILAAAVRTPAGPSVSAGTSRPEGATGTAGVEDGVGQPGVEDMLAHNADMNMYYLQLQEQISAESRAYSTMSNVLKARHDTVKNAIGNIR
ncbi:MAG: hypothetical protein R3B13_15985 [Polyangiaceae bacterium]